MRVARWRAIGVAAVAVSVASAVVLVLQQHADAPRDSLLPQSEPSPQVSLEPSESAKPTPTTSASPTGKPSPTSAATRTSSSGEGDLGPAAPGSVSLPHNPGQSSWSGTSEGISIRVSITPTAPRAGSPVTFTVRTSGQDQDCCAVYIVYGDGGTTESIDCPLPDTGGSTTVTRTHTYNKSGPHRMLIQAISDSCKRNGVLYATIDIGTGPSAPQGPELPVVQFSQSQPAQDPTYHTVTLWGIADDADGHITKLVVNFGDGTTKTFTGDPMDCVPTRDGWPGPSQAKLPSEPPYPHKYAAPGTYTLRLTAYSAGCSGAGAQTSSASFTFTVPEPPQEPTQSPTPSPTSSPT